MREASGSVPTLNLIEMARRMFDASVAGATGRLRLDEPADVYARLAEGDPTVVSHVRHELARQIGAALLWMDPRVTAVYEHCIHERGSCSAPLRLIVEVDDKSAALESLIAALGQALREAWPDSCQPSPEGVFDALVVNDRDARMLFGDSRGLPSRLELLMSREEVFAGELGG